MSSANRLSLFCQNSTLGGLMRESWTAKPLPKKALPGALHGVRMEAYMR